MLIQPLIQPNVINRDDNAPKLVERKQAISIKGYVPDTLDEKNRSVEVIAASETPCEVYDPNRWEVVTEILLMSGVQIPESGQVPLTVDHFRSVNAVIGSLRDMRVESNQLIGRVYFASSDDAEPYWIKVKEGHLDRFSITYPADSRDSVYVAEGESSTINGVTYEGPVLVTKQWTPKALGLVTFPADKNAKARGQSQPSKEVNVMNAKLRKFLERSGLPETATEAEAWAFLERMEAPRQQPAGDPPPDADTIRAEATGDERNRVVEIDALCNRFECSDLAADFITKGTPVDVARQKVLDVIAQRSEKQPEVGHRSPITLIADDRDKFRSAAGDALMVRGGLSVDKPAEGAHDLTGWSLREMARHSLRVANLDISGRPIEMVGRALTTSDFPYILANVANKSLFEGWDTADETWMMWCATGSVSDFKTHYAPRASETSDLDEIPEDTEYKYGKRTEAQESYAIATYGKLFAISRQTIINDDLNAITDIPRAHGEAASRKVGDLPYAVLTGNAAMGDGKALFHADHGNLVAHGSGGAPGQATIAVMILDMKTQKDLQGLRRLNIRMEYVIAPAALEGDSEVFFNSQFFDDSNKAATRRNPYFGDYFTRVYEPRLDDVDPAAWYGAGRKGKTVKIFFLDGVQKPYMETKKGWSVDGVEYKVRIDAGAKAMDWKGLQMNDGN